jgi:hypothetical protein
MKRISGTLLAALTVGAGASSTAALADNPVGFYLGAGAGYSTIRSDDPAYGLPGYYNDHQTAWKVIAGVRPIPLIGVEGEYIDFGQPDTHHDHFDTNYYGTDSHPRAGATPDRCDHGRNDLRSAPHVCSTNDDVISSQ